MLEKLSGKIQLQTKVTLTIITQYSGTKVVFVVVVLTTGANYRETVVTKPLHGEFLLPSRDQCGNATLVGQFSGGHEQLIDPNAPIDLWEVDGTQNLNIKERQVKISLSLCTLSLSIILDHYLPRMLNSPKGVPVPKIAIIRLSQSIQRVQKNPLFSK